MKTNFLLKLIVMSGIITLEMYAMEAAQLLPYKQHYYQAVSEKKNPYAIQILPDEICDKIIAYSSHNKRKNLKETCTQLAYLTSINRLDKFIMHDFVIGDEKEKSAFLAALSKIDNPKLITPFVSYAKKEGELYYVRNAIHEYDPAFHTQEQYTKNLYLDPLLKKATEQNNEIIIEILGTEDISKNIIKQYHADIRFERCIKILRISAACTILTVVGSIVGPVTWWYYNVCTNDFYGCTIPCSHRLCCTYWGNGSYTPC